MITIETAYHRYSGSGTTGPFTFLFQAWETSDIRCIKADSSGNESILVENSHYTVSLNSGSAGGTVTLTDTLDSGYVLYVGSRHPLTQETDYIEGDTFPADSHEYDIDHLKRVVQQINEKVERCLRFRPTSSLRNEYMPVPTTGYPILGYDSSGEGMQLYATSALTEPQFVHIGDYGNSLETAFSALSSANVTLLVNVANTVDGNITRPLGVHLWFTASGITTVTGTLDLNGGFIQAGLFKIFEVSGGTIKNVNPGCPVAPQWFGAMGDDPGDGTGTDDTTAVSNAMDLVFQSHGMLRVYGPNLHRITSVLSYVESSDFDYSRVRLLGPNEGPFNFAPTEGPVTLAGGFYKDFSDDDLLYIAGASASTRCRGISLSGLAFIADDTTESDTSLVKLKNINSGATRFCLFSYHKGAGLVLDDMGDHHVLNNEFIRCGSITHLRSSLEIIGQTGGGSTNNIKIMDNRLERGYYSEVYVAGANTGADIIQYITFHNNKLHGRSADTVAATGPLVQITNAQFIQWTAGELIHGDLDAFNLTDVTDFWCSHVRLSVTGYNVVLDGTSEAYFDFIRTGTIGASGCFDIPAGCSLWWGLNCYINGLRTGTMFEYPDAGGYAGSLYYGMRGTNRTHWFGAPYNYAGTAAGSNGLLMEVVGDTESRLILRPNGLYLGNGTDAVDCAITRGDADLLYTPDKLATNAGLGVGNSAAGDVTGTAKTYKVEIFDETGSSIGFIQVYAGA